MDVSSVDPTNFVELKAGGKLPSPRGTAMEIIRLSQSDSVSNQQIARVIQTDPALSAKLIKAANSPVLGVHRPVVAINQAIMFLGLPLVRQLALGFSLVSDYQTGECKPFDYQTYWSQSLFTGIAAQVLASTLRVAVPEEIFICGLLSQIGRLALATLHPEKYAVVLTEMQKQFGQPLPSEKLRTIEQKLFAIDHNTLTTAMVSDWGFPIIFAKALQYQYEPDHEALEVGSRSHTLAVALNLAYRLSQLVFADKNARTAALTPLLFDAGHLGIEADDLVRISDNVVALWEEWGQILSLGTHRPGNIISIRTDSEQKNTPAEEAAKEPELTGDSRPITNEPLRILVADDDAALIGVVKKLLLNEGHIVATAKNGQEAIETALQFNPDMVITDWVMPQVDGLELTHTLRQTMLGKGIYILIMTTFEADDKLVEAFNMGVDDYLVKPFPPRILKARLAAGKRFVQQQREMRRDVENIRKVANELAVNNRQLQQAAVTDTLTGLPNRRYAMDRLEQEWAAAKRRNSPLSLIMIDVDNFTLINDQFGHASGDLVLGHIGTTLRAKARLPDAVCRYGGDEFLIICPDTSPEDALLAAKRLRNELEKTPLLDEGQVIHPTLSLGYATADFGNSITDLLEQADQAVYRAKQKGKNSISA
ncbi:diguanylate cyclase [Ampullimonas aquatilis]|uniref:GGDEF domain-containing response regulator n=1 Tax=Ampullimonas aquatilis TaxID=1341549 RepID=UPI003C75318A